MKSLLFRTIFVLGFAVLLPVFSAAAEPASGSVRLASEQKTSWLQQKIEAKLKMGGQKSTGPSDFGWKFKPGATFRWKRKGMDWSVGPRLGMSKQITEYGKLTLNTSWLPLRYLDLKSGSRVDYSRLDAGYRHFFNRKFFAGAGVAVHRFAPSAAFAEEIARLGGKSADETITTTSISLGHQIFKIGWSFKGKKRAWPFFFETTWQAADDYQYGADLGSAGSEYKIKSGFSFRIRPLSGKF
ncbi:MAG: hypothetical protein PHD82_06675 [Candidatus Riflebacteria bacterium]|nr:hypothetical protein [Candidatus Riflebacteria bacterium]